MQLAANAASRWTLGRIHCDHGCLKRVRRGLCSQGGNRGSSGCGKKDVAVIVIQSPDSQWNRLFQGRDTNTLLAGFHLGRKYVYGINLGFFQKPIFDSALYCLSRSRGPVSVLMFVLVRNALKPS